MLTVIAHVPDSFAISFDKKHVRVIDAMAVEERKNLDITYNNAFRLLSRCSSLPNSHSIQKFTSVIGIDKSVDGIAILLLITIYTL